MLVTFEVAGQEFALELDAVQEILPAPAVVTAVPRAEALVLGVTSLRDRLLPLLVVARLARLSAGADFRRARESRRHEGPRRPSRARRGPRESDLGGAASAIDAMPPVLAARTGGEARLKAIYRGDDGRRLVSILMPEQLFREDVMRRLGQARRRTSAGARPRATRAQHAEQTVSRVPLGRRRVRAADRRRRRSRRSAGEDHALAEDAEIPRRRRQPARRRAARRRSTPPLRHAGARAPSAGASSSSEPNAIAPG